MTSRETDVPSGEARRLAATVERLRLEQARYVRDALIRWCGNAVGELEMSERMTVLDRFQEVAKLP